MYSLSSVDIQGWYIGLSWANIIQVTNQTRATEPAIRWKYAGNLESRCIGKERPPRKPHVAVGAAAGRDFNFLQYEKSLLFGEVGRGSRTKRREKKLTLACRGEKPLSYQKRTKTSWMLSLNTNYKNTLSKSRWLLDRPALPNYLLRSLVRETHLFEALNKFQVYWASRNL